MENGIKSCRYSEGKVVSGIRAYAIAFCTALTVVFASPVWSGESFQTSYVQGQNQASTAHGRPSDAPTCGIEMTCTDRAVQLGYSEGVCFRATCPGVWALIHRRVDQASFRRRFITYNHYSFTGTWELKDRGIVESGQNPVRELFLVLPDDLIEFKLRDPDCNTAVEVRNLGYIKMGNVEELKRWLAYNVYLEKPDGGKPTVNQDGGAIYPNQLGELAGSALSRVLSLGRSLGIPLCR